MSQNKLFPLSNTISSVNNNYAQLSSEKSYVKWKSDGEKKTKNIQTTTTKNKTPPPKTKKTKKPKQKKKNQNKHKQ